MKKILTICAVLFTTFFATTNLSLAYEYTQVRAEHILVKTQEEAQHLEKRIADGKSFEELAKEYSLCPSGKNGGDLGYFGRGQMVPEFEKPSFDMAIGEVSEPIQTQFGWHIIKVLDKK